MASGRERAQSGEGSSSAPDPAGWGPIRAGLAQALEVATDSGVIRARHGVLVAIAGRYADLADGAVELDTFEAAEGRLRAVLAELSEPVRPAGGDDDDDADGAPDERERIHKLIRRGPTLGDAAHA